MMYGLEDRLRELLFDPGPEGPTVVSLLSLQPWIHTGLSINALRNVAHALGVRDIAMADYIGVSTRTLQRALIHDRLSADLSDRLAVIARLMVVAEMVLGSTDEARAWMAAPQHGLDGQRPIDLMRTVTGATEVERLLGRIYHGVYA